MTGRPIMTTWLGAVAVARFQLRRLSTPQRLLLAGLGAVFPAAVMLAVRRISADVDRNAVVALIYALVPEMVCMLGLLLTMCPAVADELERGTWPHVTVRPAGRRSLLLGTFLAAVTWTTAVAAAAALLALVASGIDGVPALAAMFLGLSLLSCLGRAALFALPAVIVPRRALVASVGAALVVEYLAGFLPAIVNQVTVSLRLRSLLVSWMDWGKVLPVEMLMMIDTNPVWVQLAAVFAVTVTLLTVAVLILERRQFPPAEES